MGVEWCRMRVPDANRAQVQKLVAEQALFVRQYGGFFYGELHPLNADYLSTDSARKQARQQYCDTSKVLAELLEIRAFDKSYQYQPDEIAECWRASILEGCPIFPAEWRIDCYRSYLPEELPERLSQWRTHLNEVRNGAHRGHLFHWYLYTESHNALEFWKQLRDAVDATRNRTNAWAIRLAASTIPEKILAISKPDSCPPPKWSDWQANSREDNYDADERYIQLQNVIEQMHVVRREWNRRVPSRQKLSTTYVPFATHTFPEYMRGADYPQINELFDWLEQCVRDGMGLYLWA